MLARERAVVVAWSVDTAHWTLRCGLAVLIACAVDVLACELCAPCEFFDTHTRVLLGCSTLFKFQNPSC